MAISLMALAEVARIICASAPIHRIIADLALEQALLPYPVLAVVSHGKILACFAWGMQSGSRVNLPIGNIVARDIFAGQIFTDR